MFVIPHPGQLVRHVGLSFRIWPPFLMYLRNQSSFLAKGNVKRMSRTSLEELFGNL
jgi:hypothetical protein